MDLFIACMAYLRVILGCFIGNNKSRYVLHQDNKARFVLLLNKRDRFRHKLALVPLHEASHHFRNVPGRTEEETHEQYCVRCEEQVVHFFLKKEHCDKNLVSAEFTNATDSDSFGLVMKKLWYRESLPCSVFPL